MSLIPETGGAFPRLDNLVDTGNSITDLTVTSSASITGDITMASYSSGKLYPKILTQGGTASGDNIIITSIPTWVRKITVIVRGLAHGTSVIPVWKIGNASGLFPWTSPNGCITQTGSTVTTDTASTYPGLAQTTTLTTISSINTVCTFESMGLVSNQYYWLVRSQYTNNSAPNQSYGMAMMSGNANERLDKIQLGIGTGSPSWTSGNWMYIFE